MNTDTSTDSVRHHLKAMFPEDDVRHAEISRMGGMSNKNYKVTIGPKSYVLRIPGNGAEGMVERANEEFNAILASKLGVNPPITYFNNKTGIKLTDYCEGAETLNAATIQQPENMDQIAAIYQKVHNSDTGLKNEFNIFREIEKYDRLIDKAGARMYDGFEGVRKQVMELENRLNDLNSELKPCHNDPYYENFIKTSDGIIYLIDWEYSGMNDPMADFAALFLEAGFEKENEDYILDRYFNGRIPLYAREKISIFQILWDYLWAQWTVIKEAKGDDFGSYGIDRFNRAISNLNKIN